MIVECSNCHAKYNVDESKIPDTGIKVKCHKCQSIIFIEKEEAVPKPKPPEPAVETAPPEPAVETAPPEPAPATTPPPEAPTESPAPVPPVQPAMPSQPVSGYGEVDLDAPPEVSAPEPPVPAEPEPVKPPDEVPESEDTIVESPPSTEPETSFVPEPAAPPEPVSAALPEEELSEEDKKWHERARRLAKALASDLVLYNQDKVEEGLRDGTLAQLLGSEIRRSWEYYCQQIPKHIVDSTDHFKQQLNKIVGKGKEIFK